MAHRAPIALFVYNRPEHTQETIAALRANPEAPESDLYIFADGPRGENDAAAVAAVRHSIQQVTGFRSVTLSASPKNKGLANSIIAGVTKLTAERGSVIVLEDDMVTAPYFLAYMNEALRLYNDDERVISIHGYCYPVKETLPTTFFLKGADCWGWATWQRGWQLFRPDASGLLAELTAKRLLWEFDFNGTFNYVRMLQNQIAGKVDSWAIRWYASAFLADKLTLYPGRPLLRNTGADGLGTHTKATAVYENPLAGSPVVPGNIPVEENKAARAAVERYFLAIGSGRAARALKKIRYSF